MMRNARHAGPPCRWTSTLAAALLFLMAPLAAAPRGPQAGEVYREYASHQGGDDWRVTNPEVSRERAHKHLPNPILNLSIRSLEGAVRAEAVLDRWGGHANTKRPQIRFNGNEWLDVPPPLNAPGNGDHERYYFQDNPVIRVPLEHLEAGENTFQGTCSHVDPHGWGQWGMYSLILRVYYDPEKIYHPAGRIVSPAAGAAIGEHPVVRIEASSRAGVARVDVLAWYEGYDENGDGVWLDWHGGHFQPLRGDDADLGEHVGTLWRSPYEAVWDTRWVPDQRPRAVKLIARIQNCRGIWSVTEPVADLTLQREGQSVQLFRATEIPARFGVRKISTKSCVMPVPAEHNLGKAIEAGLHYRTWHGWDGHHDPFRLNALVHLNEGKNHHYDYDIHLIEPGALHSGDNVFEISSETEHHMLEVLWPGPALTVRFHSGSDP